MNIHWKDWRGSWNSNPLATWCKETTHWKRLWCWERLRAGGQGGRRDGWMASLTQWTEFEQTLGDGEGQGSLVCWSPWSHKELDMTVTEPQQCGKGLWQDTQKPKEIPDKSGYILIKIEYSLMAESTISEIKTSIKRGEISGAYHEQSVSFPLV